MELTEEVKEFLIKTAKELKGSARRLFVARTVRLLGKGGWMDLTRFWRGLKRGS